MQKPDVIRPVSVMGEIETRLGIPSIESLLAERDTLVKQVAELRARHGPFGTWDALRKIELATIAASLRAKTVAENRKMTEAAIDEAAHADDRYLVFITLGTEEKADLAVKENAIQGINDTIQRGNVIGRYLTAEAQL